MPTIPIDPATVPRPRWVETDNGAFAILIKIVGPAALIRWADREGGYAWRHLNTLTRRRDLDANPDPEWLARARASRRPPPALWWLLGLVPAPPDTLIPTDDDPPRDGLPVPMFEVDRDGRPIS